MKKELFDYMHTIMESNPDVYFLMLGLGYPRVGEFLAKYPGRAFNLEASEQSGLDIAVGLSYAGKIPFVYSITPFLLYRGFETLRTYINHEKLPIVLIGAGREDDYSKHDGFSHYAGDDDTFLEPLQNIYTTWPDTIEELHDILDQCATGQHARYINIKR